MPSKDGGCEVCGQDDDHANLLLCEGCNAEYHIYCCTPPLEAVPEDDWYCPKCQTDQEPDQLDILVNALPTEFTSRFNDIVWCNGGSGYGHWPACIFDPRQAKGAARTHATKHLGKKHLVYFFHCHEAPFEIKADSSIVSWEMGLAMGYHLGKTAQGHSQRRHKKFQLAVRRFGAWIKQYESYVRFLNGCLTSFFFIETKCTHEQLQAACVEESVPKRNRMKWTFADEANKSSMTPDQKQPKPVVRRRRGSGPSTQNVASGKPTSRNLTAELSSSPTRRGPGRPRKSASEKGGTTDSSRKRRKTTSSSTSTSSSSYTEKVSFGLDDLICQVWRRHNDGTQVPIGFINLPSQRHATFADVRRCIKEDLDNIPSDWTWRFWVPGMGMPVSTRQESKFGSMMGFLWKTSGERAMVGEGTLDSPGQVILVDAPKISL